MNDNFESELDILMELDGNRVNREDGYWWKVEVWRVQQTKMIPHGLRYNLTLHDKYNTRVFGMDNAHSISPPKKGTYKGRKVYDHMHRTPIDKGVPYEFTSPLQLMQDFFTSIDEVIAEREQRGKK
ncbi:DUF6516 family protein [Morganella morganii]|uniref:DUF6516 family protein n=1 Tax=Morganella morganii TaxID=582 RepID=UPI003119D676